MGCFIEIYIKVIYTSSLYSLINFSFLSTSSWKMSFSGTWHTNILGPKLLLFFVSHKHFLSVRLHHFRRGAEYIKLQLITIIAKLTVQKSFSFSQLITIIAKLTAQKSVSFLFLQYIKHNSTRRISAITG